MAGLRQAKRWGPDDGRRVEEAIGSPGRRGRGAGHGRRGARNGDCPPGGPNGRPASGVTVEAGRMASVRSWTPYCGSAPGPDTWLDRWNLDPGLGIVLAVLALVLWCPGTATDALARGRRRALRGAWALAVVLWVSPLCALGAAFFAARVVHHMVLVLAVAPLLAHGLEPWLRRLPLPPWTCTGLAALAFWTWHAPAPYEAAMSSVAVYWVMQATLLAGAVTFWAAIRRAGPAVSLAALLVAMVQMGLLGALITFAAHPLYAPHAASTLPWGVTPLEDQQRAGILMWAPGSLAYLAVAVLVGWRWLRTGRDTGLRVDAA